jgi:hypothetical protein
MQNQNSTTILQDSSSMSDGNGMQHTSDPLVSKTIIDTTDDSIHTLLNVTHPEIDDEFDPMLFQREDAMDADYLCGQPSDDGELQEVEYAYEKAETPTMENVSGHSPFAVEKEIQLDEYIQQRRELQRNTATDQSFDVFPYVAKAEISEFIKVGQNKSKNQVQIEVPMGDQEGIIQERESSFVDQNIWQIRKTVVVTVTVIVLVSIFAIA